ncbi:hypothetical protein EVAR_77982_1 [Eumeta japonica]|uniref:Uncharacterized protein n=1 Tax=Eumeta variegata TaxID=151549 RepID=A0A4C1SZT7_EUMVA|nr:hypothetical protein EVAR_77982_1 [Eumeta japonica]
MVRCGRAVQAEACAAGARPPLIYSSDSGTETRLYFLERRRHAGVARLSSKTCNNNLFIAENYRGEVKAVGRLNQRFNIFLSQKVICFMSGVGARVIMLLGLDLKTSTLTNRTSGFDVLTFSPIGD